MTWLLLVCAGVAPAQTEAVEAEEDFRGYLDQARFFLRKEWYEDAQRELEAAVRHPDGQVDPEAWHLLATVRWELGNLVGAREAAAKAHTYSRTEQQLEQAASFSSFVHEQFGVVTVRAPYPGMAARLDVDLQSMLFDPHVKEFLEDKKQALRQKQVLPRTFGLPVGTYLINGQEVEVTAEGPNELTLPTSALGARGPTATKLLQGEMSAGLASWLGSAVDNHRPSFNLQAALSLPVGPVRAALVFDWIPAGYTMIDGAYTTNVHGWSAGARAGIDVPGTEPIVIRPSVGYRYGLVPGIEVRCTASGGTYACGDTATTDVVVYAVGRAHIPWFELSVGHLDTRRTMDLGFGVKGVIERAFGTLPPEGKAAVLADGTSLPFDTDPEARAWSATGVRALAHLSVAF